MKVIDILRGSKRPFASFELVPPLKGSDASRLYQSLDPLMEFQPPFINITCHRDEVEYVPNGDGTYTRMTLAKRPGTVAIVAAIMRRYPELEIVPHVICGGSSSSHVESELLDLHFLGINNIMALRGDALPGQKHFAPEPDGFAHSSELVGMISNLNRGQYLDPTVKNGLATDFCIGVAAYPEKHFEAANLESDICHLKQKVEAGADYIVTQMFFDNDRFFRFVELRHRLGYPPEPRPPPARLPRHTLLYYGQTRQRLPDCPGRVLRKTSQTEITKRHKLLASFFVWNMSRKFAIASLLSAFFEVCGTFFRES